MAIDFRINGKAVRSEAPADTPLLWVIREQLKLTGTKFDAAPAYAGRAWSTLMVNAPSLVKLRFPRSAGETIGSKSF